MICNSCILTPLPEKPKDLDVQGGELVDKDLPRKQGVTREQLQQDLTNLSTKSPEVQPDKYMKNLKLQGKGAFKSRTVTFGSMILEFNDEGVAVFPEPLLTEVEKLMRLKPGRFHVMKDEDDDVLSAHVAAAEAQIQAVEAEEEPVQEEVQILSKEQEVPPQAEDPKAVPKQPKPKPKAVKQPSKKPLGRPKKVKS